MRRLALALVAALAVAAGCSSAAPAHRADAAGDIRALVEEMEQRHPDLYHYVSREEFRRAAGDLVARLPGLERDRVLVEVMRLTAMPGWRNGHTGMFPFDPAHRVQLHGYPIRLDRFPDGTVVVGEIGALGLVGSRLAGIDGTPLDEVVERVRPLIGHDNALTIEARLPEFLVAAEVLHGLGIARAADRASFSFETPAGPRKVTLEPVSAAERLRMLGGFFEPPVSERRPLWARYRDRPWAVTTIANGTAVYMAYNSVARGVSSAAETLLRLARRPKVRRVIVDVRFNGGGDNTTYGSLLDALRRPVINRRGRLAVLIGRLTFSAAGNFVSDVDRQTRAVFVGEPTGGSPSQWGDAISVPLPTLGWTVHVATTYQWFGPPGDARLAIEPDVPVAVSSADFLAGRDPVLRAALDLRARAPAQAGDVFAYDPAAPLDIREQSSTVNDGVRTIELTYASPKGGRVPAMLVLPASGAGVPALIFQHGAGNATREDFRPEAEDLARSGLASLLIDAPLARPGHRNWMTFQLRDRAAYVQNVIDLRRGIDLLEQRADVDATRIALVGHSYGGSIAGVVAGVEPRVDALVVMSGPGRMTDFLRQQGQAWVRRARPGKPRTNRKKQLARYLAYMRAVDAAEWIGRATAPILFQFGRQDPLPARWFQTYVNAAPPAKRVEWYDAGHALCDCATRDRKAWLLERRG